MPVQVSYPGVYIQEATSTVHTITPVATSITAFVGQARRGPVNTPVEVGSWAEFLRQFGDFWPGQSRLAYSVYDFFSNGGSSAIVVRVHPYPSTTPPPDQDCATLTLSDGVELYAASPGLWGRSLTATVDDHTAFLSDTSVFNLTITDTSQPTAAPQKYFNVTFNQSDTNGAYLPNVLNSDPGAWVKVKVPFSGGTPQPPSATTGTPPSFGGGSDGGALKDADIDPTAGQASKTGMYALENTALFNLLVIPPYVGTDLDSYGNPQDVDPAVIADAATYCWNRKAFLLIDPPSDWRQPGVTASDIQQKVVDGFSSVFQTGNDNSKNAAVFFPRLVETNRATGQTEMFAPSGAIAGIFAATDTQRGVWKAPAGVSTALTNVPDLEVRLTDNDNGQLNPLGVNCLRVKPSYGPVVWGSRTLQGADAQASQWKYIPVRRMALFLELSLYQGTQWVVFEPNDEPLWAQIRMNINAFMQNLFQQGAFQGTKPSNAYFVKCDSETTTQTDINNGIVNIIVGFAPLLPAEFVVITLQQMAGQAGS